MGNRSGIDRIGAVGDLGLRRRPRDVEVETFPVEDGVGARAAYSDTNGYNYTHGYGRDGALQLTHVFLRMLVGLHEEHGEPGQ